MVEWQPPGQAAGLKLQVRASLAPAVPAQPVVAAILSLSLDNLAAAAATASGALQQSEEYGKEVRAEGGGEGSGGGMEAAMCVSSAHDLLLPADL